MRPRAGWTVSADSTVARAHQHAAGARRLRAADDRAGALAKDRKSGREGIGRSRGGLTTRIHLAADLRCRPVARLTSPGQHGDSPGSSGLVPSDESSHDLHSVCVLPAHAWRLLMTVWDSTERAMCDQVIPGKVSGSGLTKPDLAVMSSTGLSNEQYWPGSGRVSARDTDISPRSPDRRGGEKCGGGVGWSRGSAAEVNSPLTWPRPRGFDAWPLPDKTGLPYRFPRRRADRARCRPALA